jgi:hypothetical protein
MSEFGILHCKGAARPAPTKIRPKGTVSRRGAEVAEIKQIIDLISFYFSALSAFSAQKKSSRKCMILTDSTAKAEKQNWFSDFGSLFHDPDCHGQEFSLRLCVFAPMR